MIGELGGDDRTLAGEEQELQIGPQGADFIGGKQGATEGIGNRLTYLASRALPRSLVSRLAALPYRRPQ